MSYFLHTKQATAFTTTVPVAFDPTGATLTVEFAKSSTFTTTSLTKPVTVSGSSVTFSLTAAEVDNLKDCHFRVKLEVDGSTVYIEDGKINYTAAKAQAQVDANSLKDSFGPFFVGKPGMKYRTVLGAIRNVGAGGGYWQVIEDAAHHSTGIASVTTNGTEITVNYDFNGSGIGTFLAVPDETMAAEGYFIGSSVAANQAKIRLGRRKSLQDYIYWDSTAGNFVSANNIFTISSYTGGVLTLTHAPVVAGYHNNCRLNARGGAFRPVVSTSGAPLDPTQTKIELWTAAGVLATAGDPNMKFYVERYDIAGWADPRTFIDTTTHPNHNIWLYGLHEA